MQSLFQKEQQARLALEERVKQSEVLRQEAVSVAQAECSELREALLQAQQQAAEVLNTLCMCVFAVRYCTIALLIFFESL